MTMTHTENDRVTGHSTRGECRQALAYTCQGIDRIAANVQRTMAELSAETVELSAETVDHSTVRELQRSLDRLAERIDRETRGAAWYTPGDIEELAARTAAYAAGHVQESAWLAEPGLEPVWVELLHIARRLPTALSRTDLDAIAALAQAPDQLASRLPA